MSFQTQYLYADISFSQVTLLFMATESSLFRVSNWMDVLEAGGFNSTTIAKPYSWWQEPYWSVRESSLFTCFLKISMTKDKAVWFELNWFLKEFVLNYDKDSSILSCFVFSNNMSKFWVNMAWPKVSFKKIFINL